jgi:predicted MPP superfamily phosphohydrolase
MILGALSTTVIMTRFALLLILVVVIDLYAYRGVHLLTSKLRSQSLRLGLRGLFWIVSGGFASYMVYSLIYFLSDDHEANNRVFQYLFGLFVLFYVPKLIFVLFLLVEDFARLVHAVSRRLSRLTGHRPKSNSDLVTHPHEPEPVLINRKEFISRTGAIVASVPFFGILHGIVEGRYNYRVHRHTLTLPHLPPAFDGLRIAQISDIHAGSFDSVSGVEHGIDLLRAQEADLVFFTGDLVNNMAEEMDDWRKYFSRIEAPMGVFSTVGNHDYGTYALWDNDRQREENFAALQEVHRLMNWQLLMNQNKVFEREGQHLAVLGVENWGVPPFPQFGDLDRSLAGVPANAATILLSHDPSHWDAQVLKHRRSIDLTLSGHTHGMQFGVEVLGVKWSPVSMKYPRWAGVYQEGDRYLNVNRGFGFIGFPGRVGIFPEITLITLKSGQLQA